MAVRAHALRRDAACRGAGMKKGWSDWVDQASPGTEETSAAHFDSCHEQLSVPLRRDFRFFFMQSRRCFPTRQNSKGQGRGRSHWPGQSAKGHSAAHFDSCQPYYTQKVKKPTNILAVHAAPDNTI
jgi:hypothetical protein